MRLGWISHYTIVMSASGYTSAEEFVGTIYSFEMIRKYGVLELALGLLTTCLLVGGSSVTS